MMNIYLEIVLVNYRFANAMELAEGPFLSSYLLVSLVNEALDL